MPSLHDDLPYVIHTGTIAIPDGPSITVHHLNTGERIVPEEDVVAFLTWLEQAAFAGPATT